MHSTKAGLTRRQLTGAALMLTSVSSSSQATAQVADPASGELEAARSQVKVWSTQLRKVTLPQLLEPSFVFRP
ncbi:MAG: hypothetical protein H7039_18165 [Bryobacteraceae bacterium]|nr:hypothetical protein [Bryobacteraceae bacterium]